MRRGWLGRATVAQHALIPRVARGERPPFLRASAARSAAARMELPYRRSRDWFPCRIQANPLFLCHRFAQFAKQDEGALVVEEVRCLQPGRWTSRRTKQGGGRFQLVNEMLQPNPNLDGPN